MSDEVRAKLWYVCVMGKPVATRSDQVNATDTHIVLVPGPSGSVPTPTPLEFSGVLDGDLSGDVYVEWREVALDESTATNTPAHVAPNGSFQTPPSDTGTVQATGQSVYANNRKLARNEDVAMTCNDPADLPNGKVVASCTVFAGD